MAFIFLFVGLDVSDQMEEERDDSSHNRWLYPGCGYTAMEKRVEAANVRVSVDRLHNVQCTMFSSMSIACGCALLSLSFAARVVRRHTCQMLSGSALSLLGLPAPL